MSRDVADLDFFVKPGVGLVPGSTVPVTYRPSRLGLGRYGEPCSDTNFSPIDVSKSVKASIQSQMNPSLCPVPSAVSFGEAGNAVVFPASEQVTATTWLPVPPLSVATFDKPTETNNRAPSLSFNPNIAERFPDQPSHSGNGALLESSCSLVSAPLSTVSQLNMSESGTLGYLNPKARDANEKSETDPSAKWSVPPDLAISSTDTNQASTNGTLQLTLSTNISNPSLLGDRMNDTVTSSGSMFGLIENSPNSAGPMFKLSTIDPISAVSAASAANVGIADLGAKADVNPSFNVTALNATNSGSCTSELGSLTSHSTGSNLQGSLFSGASKPLMFSAGASISQGTTALVSSSLSPSSTSCGVTSSTSQISSPGNIFGVGLLDTAGDIPRTSTSSEFKFGESPAIPVAAAAINSSSATADAFGFNANSPSTTAVGLSSNAIPPKFSFGGNSVSASASATATASSLLSSTTVHISSGGSSSTSAITPVSSSDASSLFSWKSPKSSIVGSNTPSIQPAKGFSFGMSSASSVPVSLSSSAPMTAFTLGAPTTSAVPASTGFSFGLSTSSAAAATPSSSTAFSFGASSSSSAFLPSSSPSTGFAFGAPSTSSIPTPSPSPQSLFSFVASSTPSASVPSLSSGSLSTPSAPTNAAPLLFNSSSPAASSSPFFSFTAASASVLPTPSLPTNQPVFGNTTVGGFAAPSGNNTDQMNAEDSMAEDPVLSSAPPVFGQPPVASPSLPGFTFGSSVPSQPNPFTFGGQQNQVAPQNPSPFQASRSLEFNAGGSFSLGSGGDKSNRKVVKISRNKNRKK